MSETGSSHPPERARAAALAAARATARHRLAAAAGARCRRGGAGCRRGAGDAHHAHRARGAAQHAASSTSRSPAAPAPCWRNWSPTTARSASTCRRTTAPTSATVNEAGDALESAVSAYFDRAPGAASATAADLRAQLTRHIASARQLASRAAQRAQWAERAPGGARSRLPARRRRRRLGSRHQRHPGGRATFARRACSRHQRGARQRRQRRGHRAARAGFSGRPRRPRARNSKPRPARAWLALVREDFRRRARLRLRDRALRRAKRARVAPAVRRQRRADRRRAAAAAAAGATARCCRRRTACRRRRRPRPSIRCATPAPRCWRCCWWSRRCSRPSISLPVRRLTAATRQFAGGDRARARAARRLGGDRRARRVLQHHGRPHRGGGSGAARASGGARAAREPSARSSCTTSRITIR